MKKLIEFIDIEKIYKMGTHEVHALAGVNFTIEEGEFVAIMGTSGSGKSTAMNIMGCLDRPSSGTYRLEGTDVSRMRDGELARVRNRKIGFVFQNFNLLPRTSAIENVELPMVYSGFVRDRRKRAQSALERVGLGDRIHHKPNELSGGQQQRVAVARSLVNEPAIILADEPTGNLDTKSGEEVLKIFQELNDGGITLVIVTHEEEVAQCCKRILRFRDGLLINDEPVKDRRKADPSKVHSPNY
ncbi:ABC transporter ATP-binding protein [bacterium]|nr:ABC transporter ATP-binding protein [bacterium]MCB1220560.1 ABC transporter ATP-binding protein [bacterium]UNM09056.1 MAG: ABC transporter ATP-binding protein [Planctomycetales bacterium]